MEHTPKDQIKESFRRVGEDINFLARELSILKEDLNITKNELIKICEILKNLIAESTQKPISTSPIGQRYLSSDITMPPANQHINPAFRAQNPAENVFLESLRVPNKLFSTGNEGVPTDRQTDQQTDNTLKNNQKTQFLPKKESAKSSIEDAAKMLDSLDGLKKEIRIKFKQLTDQEILVFSTLYQLEEEHGPVDYNTLAKKIGLTESSIRDYIGRLLKKGIPIDKNKINNKQIHLSVSQSLKKIASLPTILQLRDI